jgi:N-acetylmuramoyl-L-alanine amidase
LSSIGKKNWETRKPDMSKYNKWRQKLKKGLVVSMLCASSYFAFTSVATAATQLVVDSNTLNVRGGPGTNHSILAQVHKGDQFTALDARGDWYKIKVDGKEGWVAGWLVNASQVSDAPAKVKQATITASRLNVRAGPSTSYSIVAKVNQGEKYTVIDSNGQWLKISLPGGQSGWIAGWFAKVNEIAVTPPTDTTTGSQSPAQKQQVATAKLKQATITASRLNVRAGPNTSYSTVAKVNQGEKYTVIDSNGQWLKISLPGGQSGWIAGWFAKVNEVAVTPPTDTTQNSPSDQSTGTVVAIIKDNLVNVRGGPGTQHGVISQVSRGQRFGVLERAGDWYKVKLEGGVAGWVAGWLVNVEKAEASPAPGDPPVETEETDQSKEQQPGQPVKLDKIEVREENEHTLVSIKASDRLNYDMFMLTNPERLVIDLKNTDLGDLPAKVDVDTKAVARMRTGWFSTEPPVVRLVFDLKKAVVSVDKLSQDRKQLDLDIYIPKIGSFLRGHVIAIDPGHGGKDPGARGPTGLQEKDVNLDIALKLAKLLAENGAQVVLTRSDDRFVDLYERTAIAERNGAEVLLSIHINANPKQDINGTSTYYRRDDGDIAPGVSQADNRRLAGAIQSELLRALGRRSLGVLQANFVVLRTSSVPAALAEIAFISNPEEEQMLRQETVRLKAAEALAHGLNNYFAN